MSIFEPGQTYTREQVQDLLGVPPAKRGGDWDTGYTAFGGAFYVFANVGLAGRTGEDHGNRWSGDRLIWRAKRPARRGQAQMEAMIDGANPVHLFHRHADRAPFQYAGLAIAERVDDAAPPTVQWRFDAILASGPVLDRDQLAALLVEEGFTLGPPRVKTQHASLGPVNVYLKRDSASHVFVVGPEWEDSLGRLVAIPGARRPRNRFYYHNATMRSFERRLAGGNSPIPFGFDFALETPKAARSLIKTLLGADIPVDSSQSEPPDAPVDPRTETEGTRAFRLGQQKFRSGLLDRWAGRCALTGIAMPEILRASHIKPWRDCSDLERLDIDNGLLLAVHVDGLFDRRFISFADDGEIMLSPFLLPRVLEALGLSEGMKIFALSAENRAFLEHHRAACLVDWEPPARLEPV